MSTLTDKIGHAKELGIPNPEDLSDEQLDAKIALAQRKQGLLRYIARAKVKPSGNYVEEIATFTDMLGLIGYQEQFEVYNRLFNIGSFTHFSTVRTKPNPYMFLEDQVELVFSALEITTGTIIRCMCNHDFAWGEKVAEINQDGLIILLQLNEKNVPIDPHRSARRFSKEEFLLKCLPTTRQTDTGNYVVVILPPEMSAAT